MKIEFNLKDTDLRAILALMGLASDCSEAIEKYINEHESVDASSFLNDSDESSTKFRIALTTMCLGQIMKNLDL